VTVDILATHSGVIDKFFHEEGDVVEVGANLLEINTEAKAPAKAAPVKAAPEAPKAEAAPVK